ncbi:MAG: cofactor-independent phosphoglycerate mutase [Eubacteriales bacterium]
MKYIIILGDGMADEPLEQLQGRTPLEVAQTKYIDKMAKHAEVGLAKTVPQGMSPGSDTANLSVMGYDPKKYYTGRSPIEALSIGVDMKPTDISFRCNIVTVSEEQEAYEDKIMLDHSASEITTEEAEILIKALKEGLEEAGYVFYAGISYRHLLVWTGGELLELTPPHDILERTIGEYLPEDKVLLHMMKKSYEILNQHPVNVKRREQGLNPANSAWFWGAGTKPNLMNFEQKTGKKGAMISAVDLLKGIAIGSGMQNISVEGANGGLHTNYKGKAQAAIGALLDEGNDFVYVHVEAPDEMGHQGNLEDKIKAIEWVDDIVIGGIKEVLDREDIAYRMLVLPDHPTPIKLRTHTSDPVPYMLYDSTSHVEGPGSYDEKIAQESGIIYENGYQLIDHLFGQI